jgi:hypothetical protein
MRKLDPAKAITLGAMCTALTVLSLYASSVLPTARLAFYFLSSVFIYMLAEQDAYTGALASFAASSFIGFLILPDKLYIAPYIALLGHYGIFRTWINKRVQDKLLSFFTRMLYCNVITAMSVCAALYLFRYDLSALMEGFPFPVWLLIPLLEAGFAFIDFLYWICQKIYIERIKSYLIPRR